MQLLWMNWPKKPKKTIKYLVTMKLRRILLLLILFQFSLQLQAKGLTIMVLNLENLFDVDGSAMHADYHRGYYKPAHLFKRLNNTAKLLQLVRSGRGPDILLLQGIENDRTPESSIEDYDLFLNRFQNTTVEEMLKEPLDYQVIGIPAEAFLLKMLADQGLGEYQIALGNSDFNPPTNNVYTNTAVFSKYPIVYQKSHKVIRSAPIQEVLVNIDEIPLTILNNQWQSGNHYKGERVRISAAKVLNDRVDKILEETPAMDILIGGNFSTSHDQSLRFPSWKKTAFKNILGEQSTEAQLIGNKTKYYNLWYELDASARSSESTNGSLSSNMNLLLTRNVYNKQGIQYRDNSFQVLKIDSLNSSEKSQRPKRWINSPNGYGLSAHFPLVARFTILKPDFQFIEEFIETDQKGDPKFGANAPSRVPFSRLLRDAPLVKSGVQARAIRNEDHLQQIFYFHSTLTSLTPLQIQVDEIPFHLWTEDLNLRNKIRENYKEGDEIAFFGELSYYRKNWQTIIRDTNWLQE